MAEDIFKWIRNISALNDEQLKQEIDLVHQNIIGSFTDLNSLFIVICLTFLIEGEEEIGSSNLTTFLEKNRSELACDAIAISDTGMAAEGYPTLSYALRAIATMEVKVSGPSHALHSGIYGGAVANPVTAAARLIASLHDDAGRIAIEGFYDDVKDMADWERAAAAESPLQDRDIARLFHDHHHQGRDDDKSGNDHDHRQQRHVGISKRNV